MNHIKLHQLELFERQHGSVDCLLIGSSVVDDGLDPAGGGPARLDALGQEPGRLGARHPPGDGAGVLRGSHGSVTRPQASRRRTGE